MFRKPGGNSPKTTVADNKKKLMAITKDATKSSWRWNAGKQVYFLQYPKAEKVQICAALLQAGVHQYSVKNVTGTEDSCILVKEWVMQSLLNIKASKGSATADASDGAKQKPTIVLAERFDIKITADKNGVTLLHVAALNGHLSALNKLLERKVDVNVASNSGARPLHYAAGRGQLVVVKRLLDVDGIDKDAKDARGITPLQTAIRARRLDVVRELVERGADVNTVSRDELTPLCDAAEQSSMTMVKLLCENGACSIVDGAKVPMQIALQNQSYDILQFLDSTSMIGKLHMQQLERVMTSFLGEPWRPADEDEKQLKDDPLYQYISLLNEPEDTNNSSNAAPSL